MRCIQYTLRKYSHDLPSIPGTGAQLARHLIERFQLQGVSVEQTTEHNDHYDPGANCVRLSPSFYNGRSLAAISVAAHEVGHAIQFVRQEDISKIRSIYVPRALLLKRIGVGVLSIMPFAAILIRAPQAMILLALVGVVIMAIGAALYLVVLPEEWDASFNKALPILKEGNYIEPEQEAAVRQVLGAAAFTYFASALADILSIWRWLAILKR